MATAGDDRPPLPVGGVHSATHGAPRGSKSPTNAPARTTHAHNLNWNREVRATKVPSQPRAGDSLVGFSGWRRVQSNRYESRLFHSLRVILRRLKGIDSPIHPLSPCRPREGAIPFEGPMAVFGRARRLPIEAALPGSCRGDRIAWDQRPSPWSIVSSSSLICPGLRARASGSPELPGRRTGRPAPLPPLRSHHRRESPFCRAVRPPGGLGARRAAGRARLDGAPVPPDPPRAPGAAARVRGPEAPALRSSLYLELGWAGPGRRLVVPERGHAPRGRGVHRPPAPALLPAGAGKQVRDLPNPASGTRGGGNHPDARYERVSPPQDPLPANCRPGGTGVKGARGLVSPSSPPPGGRPSPRRR